MTFDEWEPIGRRLFGAFPNTKTSPETVLVYFESLTEYDCDVVLNAARHCIESSTFLPTIRELIERIEPEQEALDYARIYSLDGEEASRLIEATEKLRMEGIPLRQAALQVGFGRDIRALPVPDRERKRLMVVTPKELSP